ncbi:MAG: hypothetical protein FWF88_09340 [Peptococcaceae bacterium]|nr:hypothetical protein [Peptococcaceae bacterium]
MPQSHSDQCDGFDTCTMNNAAKIINNENPDRHRRLGLVHTTHGDMIDRGVWQGPLAENLLSDYYNMFFARYCIPADTNLKSYAVILGLAAANCAEGEYSNVALAEHGALWG